MADANKGDTKFVYTVSGVHLSDAQKAKISQEIAMAVTRALVGDHPDALKTDFLTIHRVQGGRMIPTVEAANLKVESFGTVGCQ